MSSDVNLSSLDGKARLAERCKPLLAQIPDGAFGDLMKQRLTELTGVGARASAPDTHVPTQRARNAPSVARAEAQPGAQRDRVAAAAAVAGACAGAAVSLRRAAPARRRVACPNWSRSCASVPTSAPAACSNTSAIARKPRRCTSSPRRRFPAKAEWEREFLDVMVQLEDQTAQQRIDELKASETPLNADEKNELRALLLDRQAAKR